MDTTIMNEELGKPHSRTLERYETLLRLRPSSMVFARLAAMQLSNGMPAGALHLALEGVRHHPGYVTGWIVLARAHAALRHYQDARDAATRAASLHPANPTLLLLISDIQELEQTHPPDSSVPSSVLESPVQEEGQSRQKMFGKNVSKRDDLIPGMEPFLAREGTSKPPPESGIVAKEDDTSLEGRPPGTAESAEENELERLAHALERARIPSLHEEDASANDDNTAFRDETINLLSRPATETLAEIYARQGNLEEAIETYLTLCTQHPDKQDHYISRIADLRHRMDKEAAP